jgi:HD-GYP domain-containing protein (c-di-GMP phosphodiesterase class II)
MIPGTTTTTAESAATQKLLEVIRLRDRSLADHGLRAGHMAAAIAAEMGGTADDVDRAYLGGMLHDVGKLGIPEAILWKPSGLDAAEWTLIRHHPQDGHRLVVDLTHRDVAAAVLYHHERFDGEGYPHRVDASSIPMTVRIVQVADAYDAMTTDRPYQPARAASVAVEEINRCAGTQFDPDVARGLSQLLEAKLDGAMITLPGASAPLAGDPFDSLDNLAPLTWRP